jgi:hypothetical protein
MNAMCRAVSLRRSSRGSNPLSGSGHTVPNDAGRGQRQKAGRTTAASTLRDETAVSGQWLAASGQVLMAAHTLKATATGHPVCAV